VAAQRHRVGWQRVIGWWARWAVLAAAAAAAEMATSAASRADGVDSDGWRVLTADDATTTSRCIGQATDLICAAETGLACALHVRHGEVCRAVGLYPDSTLRTDRIEYRIVRAGRVDPARVRQLPPSERQEPYGILTWLTPQSSQVWVEATACYHPFIACDGRRSTEHTTITLRRRADGRWRVGMLVRAHPGTWFVPGPSPPLSLD
jgi:hypothetical protein